MAYEKVKWGELADGREVDLYHLANQHGLKASFTNLGGTWVSMEVPDRHGKMVDVVLGYDTAEEYVKNPPHFGAPIGRNANRIAGARFVLGGKEYQLAANNGPNNLHSGPDLYHARLWEAKAYENSLCFTLESPDGDQGYPGNAHISVTYELTDDDSLRISYHMVSDADTIGNFTNHSYFNLSGHGSGLAMGQQAWIDADAFTQADALSIPTGEIVSVKGTPMDFTVPKPISRDMDQPYQALVFGKGYDHNWVLRHPKGEFSLSASAFSGQTGIRMDVFTDLPGIQFYTANSLGEQKGKGGAVYGPRHGYCFETQHYPNAANTPSFPSPFIKAGEAYQTTTAYRFSTF